MENRHREVFISKPLGTNRMLAFALNLGFLVPEGVRAHRSRSLGRLDESCGVHEMSSTHPDHLKAF